MQTSPAAFRMKDTPVQYYLYQTGRGSHNGVGPINSVPPFVQRGHAIGIFLSGLFRMVRPVLWSGVKAVVREMLRTGGKILSDIAYITSSDVKNRHIIVKHVSDSAQNLIQKIRGKGRKRAALKSREIPAKKKAMKMVKTTKRDIFS